MKRKIKISEAQLKRIISEQIEKEKNDGTYMVLSNLVNLKNDIEKILSFKHHPNFDKLITGEHAWAADHITTSKDDIEEVANFMEGYFEQQNLNESKFDYKVYHDTYTSAINSALEYAEARGYEYDKDETATKIGFGPARPRNGRTNRFTITLFKNGREQRKALQIQVTDLGKKYELNAYIN
jgi:hypothetical protein